METFPLYIKRLKIKYGEKDIQFKRLEPRLNVITEKEIPVITAIQFALGDELVENDALYKNLRNVTADIVIDLETEDVFSGRYRIILNMGENGSYERLAAKDGIPSSIADFDGLIHQCSEETTLNYYDSVYADRFVWYRDPERFGPVEHLVRATNGIGATHAFRKVLSSFISDFTEPLLTDSALRVVITHEGEFKTVHPDHPNESVKLRKEDKTALDLQSILAMNRFWDQIESIRDLHHVHWPVLISGVDEIITSKERFKALRDLLMASGRQVFLEVGPLAEAVINDANQTKKKKRQ